MSNSIREDTLGKLPGLTCKEGEPVFREAWKAEAFALALYLFEAGHFTWPEWTAALAHEIETGEHPNHVNDEETYYLRWLTALERLCAEKALVTSTEVVERKAAWHRAYVETPHGHPVELRQ